MKILIVEPRQRPRRADIPHTLKVYDTPSTEYGIDGGRISKLTIRIDDVTTANYDRGWEKKPTNDATWKALQVLLHEYS